MSVYRTYVMFFYGNANSLFGMENVMCKLLGLGGSHSCFKGSLQYAEVGLIILFSLCW
jgi:hypothetical protein